jgi:hypothetical protein
LLSFRPLRASPDTGPGSLRDEKLIERKINVPAL